MTEVYILRKIKGLSNLLSSSTGGISVFAAHTTSEKEEGVPQGTYKGITFPNTEQELVVAWNDLSSQFCWGGTPQDLARIVKAKKLKYESDHPNFGKVIEEADLYDYNDPFFRHQYWWNRRKASDGEIVLKTDIIDDELYIYSYKGNPDCVDRTMIHDGIENLFGGTWELISVQKNESKKAKNIEESIDVLSSIKAADVVTKENIAIVMGVAYSKEDTDTIITGLWDAVQNPSKISKYGGITGMERIQELLKLPKEELILHSKIVQAKQLGIIKFNGSTHSFLTSNKNATMNIPASNTPQLVTWFLNNENQKDFLILEEELQNRLSR